MLAKLAALLVIVGVSSVQAQAAVYECDRYTQPNYDACDRIVAAVDWSEAPHSDGTPIADGGCLVFTDPGQTGQAGNCAISVCNTRGDGQDTYLNVVSGRAYYSTIKSFCEPNGAGGRAPGAAAGANQYIQAGATPDNYARRLRVRSASRSAKPQLRVESMTMEEMEDFWERARNATARLEEPTIQKRQDEVIIYGISRSVPQPGVSNRMTGIFQPGVITSWSTTEGYSASVGVSAGVSVGFFELFTASASIDVSMDYSLSYSETIEFDPSQSCASGQDAFMLFKPHFDHYDVSDTNQQYDIWIPVAGSGEFLVQCLG